ncbi:Alanine racemase, biosynthetic [Moraxella lacunata]|uniref:Alanine racemase n=1 Tax=Moraxella lacunata TaxID=477 RepID=A0A378T7A0_MORLA|nr:alanine racemase [Moraxella lacunata]STZ55773.1 Alanine racemase, biosynthetic [Moraxella lacunata]
MRHTHITISQTALAHNLDIIKRHAPHAHVMAMVKANAYGHGVAHCLPALMQADAFGVASFDEALAVHEICGQLSKRIILIEGVFSQDEWLVAQTHGFECVVHCQAQLDWALSHVPPMDSPTRTIWLKYNTGMNRLGLGHDDVLTSAKLLHDKGYRLILTSHFACADDKDHPVNALQIKQFDDVLTTLKSLYGDVQGSLCNSAGIINFPHAHHDWVRAGIALYGASPVADSSADDLGLSPVMNFTAQIFATHELPIGEQVGYGGLWTADKPTRIGVLSVGYGDGYPRVVTDAKVSITKDSQTYFAPIVGRVAMDMMMIDITDLPVGVGDTVVLWGDDLPADNVAHWANTISYELFCKTTNRPHRGVVVA